MVSGQVRVSPGAMPRAGSCSRRCQIRPFLAGSPPTSTAQRRSRLFPETIGIVGRDHAWPEASRRIADGPLESRLARTHTTNGRREFPNAEVAALVRKQWLVSSSEWYTEKAVNGSLRQIHFNLTCCQNGADHDRDPNVGQPSANDLLCRHGRRPPTCSAGRGSSSEE